MASTWQILCDTGFSAVARPAGSPGEPPTNPRLRFAAPGATRWTPAPRAQTYSPSNVETPERGEAVLRDHSLFAYRLAVCQNYCLTISVQPNRSAAAGAN